MYRTLIAALALSWLSVTAYAQNDLVISNVRVFTGREQIEKASIVVNGGKISEISAAPATGRVLIDGEGKTALPGLIDSHAHIFAATAGVTEAETRDFIRTKLQERLLAMLRHGVTTVKSLGDPTDIILQVRRDLREGRLAGPRMLVVGPIFTAVDGHPATSPVCQGDSWCRSTTAAEVATEADARRIVGGLADQGVDGIKIVYAGGVREGIEMKKLAKPVMEAIVDESRKRGLRATAHVVDEPSSLEVLAAGAWGIEHGPSEPLTSNALLDALMKPARSYTPTLYGNTRNNPALFQVKARTVAEAYKAGVRIIAASDVSGAMPPGRALLEEIQLLVKAGLPPEAALRSATSSAAVHVGKEKEIGTLAPGMMADILVVRGNPLANIADLFQTYQVIQNGKVAYNDDAPSATFVMPRLKNGQPDLQGMWLGAPGTRGGNNHKLFDGIEYLPAAKPIQADFEGRLGNDNLYFWCATGSIPSQMIYIPFPFMLFQDGSNFVIFHEYAHDVRVIPTDRSPHADPKKYSGMNGDSRGHWEGDTLVVDTMNFSKGRRRMNMHGDFLDENSHIVERFTLIGPDRLRYDLRVDDPTVLAKTWTATDVLQRRPKDDWIMDTSCREGEKDISHLKESPDYKPASNPPGGERK